MKETEEINSKVKSIVRIEFLGIMTKKPDDFIDKLEQLCRKYSEEQFHFKYSVEG